jgi:hypothetical protein
MKRKEGGKPARPRGGDYSDPYQKARRPRPAPAGAAPPYARHPRSAEGGAAPAYARRPRSAGDGEAPYARRPRPAEAGVAPAYARARPRREEGEGGPSHARAGREPGGREGGFTVTLDPDVARVFRGDASVNKALRLVLQLMQVVQGPPRFGARPERPAGERRGGYQGSAEARGFTRKTRFDEDEQ